VAAAMHDLRRARSWPCRRHPPESALNATLRPMQARPLSTLPKADSLTPDAILGPLLDLSAATTLRFEEQVCPDGASRSVLLGKG